MRGYLLETFLTVLPHCPPDNSAAGAGPHPGKRSEAFNPDAPSRQSLRWLRKPTPEWHVEAWKWPLLSAEQHRFIRATGERHLEASAVESSRPTRF